MLGVEFPFLVGVAMQSPGRNSLQGQCLDAWWVPHLDEQRRQKPRFDFFGRWTPLAEMPVKQLRGFILSDPTICSHDILDAKFEWAGNYEIPFDTFDVLAQLGIAMTGLQTSATHRGSLYRVHALSKLC